MASEPYKSKFNARCRLPKKPQSNYHYFFSYYFEPSILNKPIIFAQSANNGNVIFIYLLCS